MAAFGLFDRLDPLGELGRLQREINDLFEGRQWVPGFMRRAEFPLVNVMTVGDDIKVAMECPGMTRDDIELSVTGDVLTVKGNRPAEKDVENERYLRRERRAGQFARSVQLPDRVQADKAEARYENGILTVTIPRAEEAKPKRIAVKAE